MCIIVGATAREKNGVMGAQGMRRDGVRALNILLSLP